MESKFSQENGRTPPTMPSQPGYESAWATPAPFDGYQPSGPQARPWVRYWARMIDFFLFAIIIGFVLGMVYEPATRINDMLFGALLAFAYIYVEPVMLSSWGTTPGKALLRIRLRRSDGTKLPFKEALNRAFRVWLRGEGIGIPLVALFTQISAYRRLVREGRTTWDRDGNYLYTHQTIGPLRTALTVVLLIVFTIFMVWGRWRDRNPGFDSRKGQGKGYAIFAHESHIEESMLDRETGWGLAGQQVFDVMIMGGGINGTCLFDRLTRQGYAVLLVDRKDFGSGTTQASGMMVWGRGLLYLRNLDLLTIFRLSRDRDAMIGELTAHISPRMYRYIPSAGGNLSPGLVRAALYVYWAMGFFRRKSPRSEKSFHESCLLRPGVHRGSLLYEEAVLNTSDCRFAFEWLASARWAGSAALNYCTARGEYSPADRLWHLTLKDTLKGKTASVRARLVVNCGGVWTDEVNESFGIETPFRHALSKGVYIGLNRPPEHDSLMIFEMGDHRDVVTFVPWGPVSLWGPTETFPRDIEAGMSLEAEMCGFCSASSRDI